MPKPRKPKSEDSKPENSGAVVRHQKLCLSIDLDTRQIYGYTELEIAVPDIGIVGLHAENLGIESVFVDGEPTEFEYYPHHQNAENDKRWSSVSSTSSAADAAGAAYISSLERELVPNLLINCCKPFKGLTEQLDQMNLENGLQSSAEAKQNVKLVRIDYWVEKAEAGIHLDDNVIHTDNQIRRARCWFPCIDDEYQCCSYDLEFTVPQNLVAVSAGSLLYQVLSKDDPPRKTYVYKLNVPVAARWISLSVAPFKILPDRHNVSISHMCLPPNLPRLCNTVEFFHEAFSYYEDYLNAKFPFGSYKQVFLPSEMAVSSSTFGASMSIFSSQVLFDERVIDQTIETRLRLAFALARQWFGVYITPESPNDEWLLDGLAGFLMDMFMKKFLGNNEACYRRYKENCAVCKADDSGATTLSSSASCKDLYGTNCIGIYGKIRSWKSVAVLQMLEKQMGPESFCKILQKIVSRGQDSSCSLRSLSTKEFRHFANKMGNLERPFLKEFFHRWVGSCGCPILRMGFSYNKRKNIVEMAVLRECTATLDSNSSVLSTNPDSENRDGDVGWPGIMSIRVYELDGMSDHPKLPMSGETWQLLEIPCHSKLAARRYQKPKKGSKPDGSDDNGDVPSADARSSIESPLLWIRADPEMEYLAEIHLHQPVQMWINQLEKDEDVVAQAQAIAALESLPQLSFSVVNALNNFLSDSKAFWRVRVEAAFALAKTASEETDWAGLLHLVKFYKGRTFDANIGLPKPNDFRDIPEYFVLEAIPHAIAMVRGADKKSPREAVEFVLQLLKYNDNTGNPYSDVFWLSALVQSVGDLEFGQQSILFLSSLLKRIDRLLQFDRLMPSYNGILTVSCIRTLTQIALRLSGFVNLDHVFELIRPFRDFKTLLQVRTEASRALLDIEYYRKGINSALLLFMKYTAEEPSLRGQVKLGMHAMRLCQIRSGSDSNDQIDSDILVALLHLLESRIAFNNVFLRHYLFCILRILAGRSPTLYGVPRDKSLHMGDMETSGEPKNIFASFVTEMKPPEPSAVTVAQGRTPEPFAAPGMGIEAPELFAAAGAGIKPLEDTATVGKEINAAEPHVDMPDLPCDKSVTQEVPKEADAVSNSQERKMPVVKIRVKKSTATSRAEEADNRTLERSQGAHHDVERGATSSVSVDAPQRNSAEVASGSNQNLEEVNSCHDRGSRMTGSIGSAKLASEGDNFGKELQCTADSGKVSGHPQCNDPTSPGVMQDNNVEMDAQKYASLKTLSAGRHSHDGGSVGTVFSSPFNGKEKEEKEKKDKEKKRKRADHKEHRDDPEYLEKKRRKKEKKRKEKEMAKLLSQDAGKTSSKELLQKKQEPIITKGLLQKKQEAVIEKATVQLKPSEPSAPKGVVTKVEKAEPSESGSAPKFRIKIKNRTLSKS